MKDALAGVTDFYYDQNGNQTTLIDAEGHPTYFEWDEMDRMSRTKDAVGKEQGWEHDPVGDVSVRLDGNGDPTYYTYDPGRQLTDIDYPDATQTTFAYDDAGNRTEMVDTWGTTAWQYDALDRATVRTQPGDSHTYYAYDAVGNRRSVIDPDENEAAYTYDPADRMWAAAAFGYTTYYEFAANDRMIEKLLGNGCVTYHDYDAAGRLTSLENLKPDLSALSTFAYTYDKDSNITEIVRESGEVQYYSYDALHRLTGCDWSAGDFTPIYSFEYDYDGVGNRTRLGREYGDTYYTYDEANELVTETDSDGTTSYEFDANGNQSAVADAAGTTYYEWTPENMLSRIDFADGGHNYFEYDGNLARVRKDDSAGTTKYTWDALNILLERDAADQPVRSYAHGHTPIYGIGSLVAHEGEGDVSFYHQDQIGSTRNLSDAASSEVAGYQYAPFGGVLSNGGEAGGGYLFTGKPWDADAGTCHFRARQYNAGLARLTSRDPDDGSPEYAYAMGNPVGLVDPDGEEIVTAVGIGLAIGGTIYKVGQWVGGWYYQREVVQAEEEVEKMRSKMEERGGPTKWDQAEELRRRGAADQLKAGAKFAEHVPHTTLTGPAVGPRPTLPTARAEAVASSGGAGIGQRRAKFDERPARICTPGKVFYKGKGCVRIPGRVGAANARDLETMGGTYKALKKARKGPKREEEQCP